VLVRTIDVCVFAGVDVDEDEDDDDDDKKVLEVEVDVVVRDVVVLVWDKVSEMVVVYVVVWPAQIGSLSCPVGETRAKFIVPKVEGVVHVEPERSS
jgi:hypothetical protein